MGKKEADKDDVMGREDGGRCGVATEVCEVRIKMAEGRNERLTASAGGGG